MEYNHLMKILPIFLQREECNLKIKPSEFMREMRLSTDERTENLLRCKRNFLTEVVNKAYPSTFKPSLPIIIFQNFTATNVYTVPLSILNKDKITRPFTVTCEKSPYFSVHYNGKAIVKVAPGISEKIVVKFVPRERKDYHHLITIKSDCANFNIPIFAIGPRPLLDFPDDINFNKCPVRVPITKVLCVFNVGEVDALFTVSTKSPFEVQPRNCVINSGKNLQISVTFESSKAGIFKELIEISLQSGEKLFTNVNATAENSLVSLNTKRLNFEETYAGLSRHKELVIHNNASHIISYRWLNSHLQKNNQEVAQVSEQNSFVLHCKEEFKTIEQVEKETVNLSLNSDRFDHDLHDFSDYMSNDKFLFNHKNFLIDPKKGDIWPGNSVDIQVIFMPDCGPKIYNEMAFCETSGCEEMLTLQLYGEGLGPNISLLIHVLDVGEIFIKMKYSYEVVVANKGDISGKIRYFPAKLDYGGVMECKPKYYHLEPEEHKAFTLSYIAFDKGEFIEEVTFKISKSDEIRKLILKGHAKYGKLDIHTKLIDFGKLPLGFPVTENIVIYNPCPIPIIFYAYIRGKSEHYSSELKYSASSKIIDELTIEPSVGCLEPYQLLNATIKLIAQIPNKGSFDLVVEMWDGLAKPTTIPITYEIVVPEIKNEPSEIYLSFCFINYPYSCGVQLYNPTKYPARFIILPQEIETHESMTILPDMKEGIINGFMNVNINFSVMVHKVGKFSNQIKVHIFGLEEILRTKIFGEGQGPIVTIEENKLSWEQTPLFTKELRHFKLYNQSPIPADFSCKLLKETSYWKADPSKGIIGPKDDVTISVELYLIDDGPCNDTVEISIRNTGILLVNLSAVGCGTPISTDPPIHPFLDLGNIFCSSEYIKEIVFKNNGTKVRTIEFCQLKKKNEIQSTTSSYVFKFHPQKLVLHPGQNQSIFVEANHKRVEELKESFWFWCTEDGKVKKQKILEGYVKASFITFHLNFSTKSLNLVSYKGERIQEYLVVSNDTSLPVSSLATVDHPFKLVKERKPFNDLEISLMPWEELKILVEFYPSFLKENLPKKFLGNLTFSFASLPHVYKVELTGEVKFPHLSCEVETLDFGCICSGKTSQRTFRVTNDSPFPVRFEWKWSKGAVILENEKSFEKQVSEVKNKNMDKDKFSVDIFDGILKYLEKEKEKCNNLMQFPEVSHLFSEDEDLFHFLTVSAIDHGIPLPVSWVFDVMPNYGELEPHTTVEISLLFRGYVSLEASADLHCVVADGMCDPIHISAKSSILSYCLDKTYIDFKEQLFCKMCYENIKIRNTGKMEVYFQSNFKEKVTDYANSKQIYQPCSLTMHPDEGHVPGLSTVTLEVSFFPGKIGPVKGSFFVEIPEVEPIKIDIEAFGVFPQVLAHLPKDTRPSSSKYLSAEIEYIGIASLNKDCFSSESLSIDWQMFRNSELIANCETDWVMVTYEDEFPTTQEICLAIERQIASYHISENFDFLPLTQKCISIPGFVVTPYIVDMGCVLVGEESTYSVLLENYGSLVAQIHLLKECKENMARAGFALSISNGKLPSGKMAVLYITLAPVKEIYSHKFHKVDLTMFLDVIYGARIPIRVLANITYPFLRVDKENLYFGEVKCGQCKVLWIELTNLGWVECFWKVAVVLTNKNCIAKMSQTPDIKQNSLEQGYPYSITPCEGKLGPGEGRNLKVLFEPPFNGLFKGCITITVEKNALPIIMKMKGIGLDPVLEFNKSEILFKPIIPSIQKSRILFLIKNPNNYPVEIFLPVFDRQKIEKELIFEILFHHYEVEDLMIPIYGNELPEEYKDFLNWKIDILLEEIQKQNDNVVLNEKAVKPPKKPKSHKSRKSSTYSFLEEKHHLHKSDILSDSEQQALRETVIHSFLSGGIKEPVTTKKLKDPISSVMDKISRNFEKENLSCASSSLKQASVYIFHGSPFSDYVQMAHRVSCALEKPVIDLDTVLLREIVLGNSSAGSELKSILIKKMNDFYSKLPGNDSCLQSPEIDANMERSENPVEVFSNRLSTYLFHCGGNIQASSKFSKNSKVSKEKSFHKSEISKNRSNFGGRIIMKPPECVLWIDLPDKIYLPSIPDTLIESILTMRLQQSDCLQGFVIPKLKSIFFQNLESALTSILKATHGIYSIEVILIHNSFEQEIEKLSQEKEFKDAKETISKKEQSANLDANRKLLLLDAKYGCFNKADAYLMKIKQKVHQIRKFSKIIEFAEYELQKELSNKKMNKYKGRRKSGNDITGARITSKASKKSAATSFYTEGTKAPKKVSGIFKESILENTASPQKSPSKFSKSDGSHKNESPSSEKVLSVTGLEDAEVFDLRNQFDDYKNLLIKLFPLLENWPMKSDKKSSKKQKTSPDMKVKSSKMSKKSTSALSDDAKSSVGVGCLPIKSEKTIGIPVVIVNSPSIDGNLMKTFFNVKFAKRMSNLTHPTDASVINHNNCSMKKLPEITYLHIRKSWYNRANETIENSFTIKSPDSQNIDGHLEIDEMVQSMGTQESAEQIFNDFEDITEESENKGVTNEEDERSGKLTKRKSRKLSKDSRKLSERGIEARHILQPEETIAYIVDYHPQEKGTHSTHLTVEMSDWQKRYQIKISGISDIPEVDRSPESIFEKCAQDKPKSCPPLYSPTYFYDIDTLDFGLLLVEKKLDEQYTSVVSKLTFHNISYVTVQATFQLEKQAAMIFSIDRENIEIKSREMGFILLKARAKRPLRFDGTLVCTINNNPDKMQIKLTCLGHVPEIEIFPKQLPFDPLLLFHKKRHQLTLKNNCSMTFFWQVSSKDFIHGDEFDVIPNNGFLPCFSSLTIEVEFLPSKVIPMFKKPLQIEFFHSKGDSEVLISGTTIVLAESYDVLIDVQFAKVNGSSGKKTECIEQTEEPNHLNFGLTKATIQNKMLITLGNVGKYDVLFKFVKNREHLTNFGENIFKIFKIDPISGILIHGNKASTIIQVECLPDGEFDVNNIPLYFCRITDTNILNAKKAVVANIPIHFSITSVYSKYSIFPYPELNFGPLKINSEKSLTFTIHNKGIFEFTFSVVKPGLNDHVKNEGIPLASARKKGAGDRNLELGCFTISPCRGTVLPNECVVITVHCFPIIEGKLKEVVNVCISNTPDLKAELNLVANSCIPSIEFSTPEKMFIEHIICEDFRVFKWPAKLDKYTVYSKKDNELAFKNIFVGCSVKARIFLRNTSLINSIAKISIRPIIGRLKIGCQYHNKKQLGSHESYKQFFIKPSKVNIPPCSGKWITVTFTPIAMEVYCALLTISVNEDNGYEDLESEEETEIEDINDDEENSDEEAEKGIEKVEAEEMEQIFEDERENYDNEDVDEKNGKVEEEIEVEGDEGRETKFRESILQHILGGVEQEWDEISDEEINFEDQEIEKEEERQLEENIEDDFEIGENQFSWHCLLSGEGLLPILSLTCPSEISKQPTGKYSIILPTINVGSTKVLKFGFQNIGFICCKVIIEFNGSDDFFEIFPTEKSTKLIRKLRTNVPLKSMTTIKVKPSEELTFRIHFHAKAPAILAEDITITPVGNPFGSIVVSIEAESTRHGIIIEGLSYIDEHHYISLDPADDSFNSEDKMLTNSLKIQDSNYHTALPSERMLERLESKTESPNPYCKEPHVKSNSSSDPSIISAKEECNLSDKVACASSNTLILARNLLEFKDDHIGNQKVLEFKLLNHSQISYDYEWIGLESIPQLQLTPRKGVLRALSSVSASAIFFPDKPVYTTQVLIKCFLERAVEYYHIEEDVFKILDNIEYKDIEEENIVKLIESDSLTVSEFRERNILEDNKVRNNNSTFEEILNDNQTNNGDKRASLQMDSSELKDDNGWKEEDIIPLEEKFKQLEDNGKDLLVLPIIFQAVIDYASYSCDISSEICLGTVAVGMSKSYDVTLMNIGNVPLKFQWKFQAFNNIWKNKSTDNEPILMTDMGKEINMMVKEAVIEVENKCIKSEQIYDPFLIIPSKGKLSPNGDFIVCKIIFSPLRFGDYEAPLICRIDNLPPGTNCPKTLVKGKARCIQYYFNYEEINFLSYKRRKLLVQGKLNNMPSSGFLLNSRMANIEIHSTGVGHTIHKALEFYNFTTKKAVFNWKNRDFVEGGVLEWSCSKLTGLAPPRSVTPMTFSFTPSKIGLFESHWSFSIIDDSGMTEFPIFQLIGISSEPAVYFLDGYIKMKSSYHGVKSSKNTYLVNDEEIPLKFQMDASTCSLENENGMLKIEPTKGILDPKSKSLIRVIYLPQLIGRTYFHVKFLIEKRPSPLYLTVKCGSYELLPQVEFHIPPNPIKSKLISNEVNDLNLGLIREGCSYQGYFEISNKGNTSFSYFWKYSEDVAKMIGLSFCLSPSDGIVYPASTIICSFTLSVLRTSKIENFKMLLNISEGPHYVIYLSMVANRPKCIFSFKSYNFGKCIVPPTRVHPKFKEVILTIKGKEKEAMMLECKFQSTNHITAHLKKTVLLFDEEVEVPIRFSPKEMIKYKEKIPFVINDKWEKFVVIQGEGIPLKLELINPDQKYINFKSVRVGCRVSKKISVKNYTAKSINVSFGVKKYISEKKIDQRCTDDKSLSVDLFYNQSSEGFIELLPEYEVSLKHGDVIDLHATFSPTVKMTDFSKKIVAVVRDFEEEIPLCVIRGRSKDLDVTLTSGCIQFGNIVKGSTGVHLISLINKGDKGTKFEWDPEGMLDSQFSITPTFGSCCPGQNVSFKVAFTPVTINKYVECKINCQLKGQDDLPLELSGRGTELPPIKEILTFNTPVREIESKSVSVVNRSKENAEVRPFLKGEYFYGADVLIIKPSSEVTYPIKYAPMTLTEEGNKHHGILYLHLPNGEEYSWNLSGTANPPNASSEIKQKVECKVWHVEILTIQNWLPVPQRFHVTTELIPGKYGEPTFFITGYVKNLQANGTMNSMTDRVSDTEVKKKKSKGKTLSMISNMFSKNKRIGGDGEPGGYLDVPGNGFSQYKLKFICYEECSLDFKVIFTNQNTGEYLYHKINFTVEEHQSPNLIEINTKVRRETIKKLDIENPLSSFPLIFSIRTELSFIFMPEKITVAPKDKETLSLRYFPLHEGYFSASLLISCPELGLFSYELRVNVEPLNSKEYREILFTASLGSLETSKAPPILHNYADKSADFICEVDSEAFLIKEHVQVMPEVDRALNVIFEPTKLGSFCATLSCKSEVAGSFFYKLKGMCIPPKTEGPFIVKANSEGTEIVFKNVFTEGTQFSFNVTEPFQLDSYSKFLEPKQETVIIITFHLSTSEFLNRHLPVNGMLVITLADEVPQKLKWEYYLKGIHG